MDNQKIIKNRRINKTQKDSKNCVGVDFANEEALE